VPFQEQRGYLLDKPALHLLQIPLFLEGRGTLWENSILHQREDTFIMGIWLVASHIKTGEKIWHSVTPTPFLAGRKSSEDKPGKMVLDFDSTLSRVHFTASWDGEKLTITREIRTACISAPFSLLFCPEFLRIITAGRISCSTLLLPETTQS